MLCSSCRVHLRRDFPYCLHCGTPSRRLRPGQLAPPVLVPLDGGLPEPVALNRDAVTVGRAPDNDLVLDDPSVSRHHARFVRRNGVVIVEDLDSLNGVHLAERTLHGAAAELADGAELEIGDVRFRFDQPRPEGVGGRTVHGAAATMVGSAPVASGAPTAGEPLAARPRLRSGWSLKRLPGEPAAWVVASRSGQYLQLDERDAFVFRSIDGESTVRDLLFRYAEQYGELALPRIERALRTFAAAGLVAGLPGATDGERGRWRRAGSAALRVLTRLEIAIGGLDRGLGRLYRAIGWRAFTRTGALVTWTLLGLGLVAFFRAQQRQRLFDTGGAGWWGVVAVAGGYLLALVVHEAAHALAVKSYGRTVRRGGFMIMMGMPFAFVDTSDMWFGTRWSRVVVAMSGPISTAVLAGVAAMGAAWLPAGVAPALCFQLAYGLYMNTAYNFNPVMPLDGYQALTDAFRIPRLREEARDYFTRGLWRDLMARRRPRLRQLGLALYGLAAVVGGYVFLMLGLIAWRHRLGPLVRDHVPTPWDSVLLVAAIALVTLPVWLRAGKRIARLVRARTGRRPAPAPVELPAEAAA